MQPNVGVDNMSAIDMCADLSAHGFVFANPEVKSSLSNGDQSFHADQPSAVMIASSSVSDAKYANHIIATIFDQAPQASFFHLAISFRDLSEDQRRGLEKMGAVMFPYDSQTMYGCIPFSRSLVPSTFSVVDVVSELKSLKLPTVPYPATAPSLSLIPSFASMGIESHSFQDIASKLLTVFGQHAYDLSLPSTLQDALESTFSVSNSYGLRR